MSRHATRRLLLDVLRQPDKAAGLDGAQWDLLLRQAQAASLQAHLGLHLAEAGLSDQLPNNAQPALMLASRQALQLQASTRREIAHVRRALHATGVRHALLKGGAYLAIGAPAARGRLTDDLDILVPRSRLNLVESALMIHGWTSPRLDAHEQRYYRRWRHQTPPLLHRQRGTRLTVHHSLVGGSARLRMNTPALFDSWESQGSGEHGAHVLSPVDLLLHSACDLFHRGDFSQALRDLVDLDSLLRHFGAGSPGFWPALVSRSHVLRLQRPLFYALRYCQHLLDTPVPDDVLGANAPHSPDAVTLRLMDACWLRALLPPLPGQDNAVRRLASLALTLRSHWLRLPNGPLARHLVHQTWRSLLPSSGQGRPDTRPAALPPSSDWALTELLEQPPAPLPGLPKPRGETAG